MSDKNTTQFLEMMKSMMNPELYMNSIKNLPPMDLSSMVETISKAAKIITTANQIAAESWQSMIQKNSKFFQASTMNMVNSAKKAAFSGDLKQVAEF